MFHVSETVSGPKVYGRLTTLVTTLAPGQMPGPELVLAMLVTTLWRKMHPESIEQEAR
jgi:hypothetical protein